MRARKARSKARKARFKARKARIRARFKARIRRVRGRVGTWARANLWARKARGARVLGTLPHLGVKMKRSSHPL